MQCKCNLFILGRPTCLQNLVLVCEIICQCATPGVKLRSLGNCHSADVKCIYIASHIHTIRYHVAHNLFLNSPLKKIKNVWNEPHAALYHIMTCDEVLIPWWRRFLRLKWGKLYKLCQWNIIFVCEWRIAGWLLFQFMFYCCYLQQQTVYQQWFSNMFLGPCIMSFIKSCCFLMQYHLWARRSYSHIVI